MKISFTLIEVIISIFLVSIIANIVISVASNYKFLIQRVADLHNFELKASAKLSSERRGANMYENLIDFNISDDEVIHFLKREKIDSDKSIKSYQNLTIETIKIYDRNYSTLFYRLKIK